MPNYQPISPSKEASQQLSRPIVVVNRTIAANSAVAKHRHSWGQLVYASTGILSVVTDSARYIVPPEQGVWVSPNIDHQVTAISDVELTSFYFDQALTIQCGVLNVSAFLKALIVEAKKIESDYLWEGSDGRLLRLIADRLASAEKVSLQLPLPQDPRLLTMLHQLQLEPSNRNNLAQWGQVVGASARSLSRLFKQQTGLTYSEWRQRLNIQIAITKLYAGESVTNIALDLGYQSPSAFIYMFRQQTGATPGLFHQE